MKWIEILKSWKNFDLPSCIILLNVSCLAISCNVEAFPVPAEIEIMTTVFDLDCTRISIRISSKSFEFFWFNHSFNILNPRPRVYLSQSRNLIRNLKEIVWNWQACLLQQFENIRRVALTDKNCSKDASIDQQSTKINFRQISDRFYLLCRRFM